MSGSRAKAIRREIVAEAIQRKKDGEPFTRTTIRRAYRDAKKAWTRRNG